MPIQPRPMVETIRALGRPRLRVGTDMVHLPFTSLWGLRSAGSTVEGDLLLNGVECRLELPQPDANRDPVSLQQGQALDFGVRTGRQQGKVSLDLPDGHRRRPQATDEYHPADVLLGEPAVATGLATDVEQTDPLVVPQGV